jgi:valyl-tRNA synthetase
MRLLHPFTPYVTEELWGHLKQSVLGSQFKDRIEEWPEALIIAPWPEPRPEEDWELPKVKDFELIQEIVRTIRNLRAEKDIKPGKKIPANIVCGDNLPTIQSEIGSIATLAKLDQGKTTVIDQMKDKPQDQIALVAGAVEIYLPLKELVDVKEEKSRLSRELKETEKQIKRLEELLSGPFSQKAPKELVTKEKEKLTGYRETASTLLDQINNLNRGE